MPKPKPSETFTRYDTADYLKDEERILAYLEVASEQAVDDPAIIAMALSNIARAQGLP
jgi:probable addiction module antidote protein